MTVKEVMKMKKDIVKLPATGNNWNVNVCVTYLRAVMINILMKMKGGCITRTKYRPEVSLWGQGKDAPIHI